MNHLKDVEYKPLSYALNRAKRRHGKDAQKELSELIGKGRLTLRAHEYILYESDNCFSFSLHESTFLPKSEQYEQRDREAYDLAYSGQQGFIEQDDRIHFIHRARSRILVWIDVEKVDELENAELPLYVDRKYRDTDYLGEFSLGPGYEDGTFFRFQMTPNRTVMLSRYREHTRLQYIDAKGLQCPKSTIDFQFPYSREHRSQNRVGGQPKFDQAELFGFLDERFITLDRLPTKKEVQEGIRDYESSRKDYNGGASDNTIRSWASKYLESVNKKLNE